MILNLSVLFKFALIFALNLIGKSKLQYPITRDCKRLRRPFLNLTFSLFEMQVFRLKNINQPQKATK
jgi:hypothetical protein